MGTKDTITKDYMADNRVFADVFNHMLYKGKNIIDPDTLHPLDTTALAVPYGSGTSEVPVQKFRDEFKSLNVMHDDSSSLHSNCQCSSGNSAHHVQRTEPYRLQHPAGYSSLPCKECKEHCRNQGSNRRSFPDRQDDVSGRLKCFRQKP